MKYNHKTALTSNDFRKTFKEIKLTKNELALLQALYNSPNHKATGLELQSLLGKSHSGGINLTFSSIAKKITKKTTIYPSSKRSNGSYQWWGLLAIGEPTESGFSWKLKPEVIEAIEKERILEPKIGEQKRFEFKTTFPIIKEIIEEGNLSKIWVDRDEIALRLEQHHLIQKEYLSNSEHDTEWLLGNMVDWFSASFTAKSKWAEKHLAIFERKRIEKVNKSGKKRTTWAYRVINTTLTEEVEDTECYFEGSVSKIIVNRYERDSKARKKCIDHHGLRCKVCEFNFEEKYGELGKSFIHVHHKRELNLIGKQYKVNPIKDLVPVCPNCHAMLHKRKPAYTIKELRGIINKKTSH